MATYTQTCSQVGGFSYASNFTLYVELTESNIDISNNKSTVNYNVYCKSNGSGALRSNHYLWFALNAQVIKSETIYVNVGSPNAYISIASGSMDFYHDNDGSKTIGFEALIDANSYGLSAGISDNYTLTSIPRTSTISSVFGDNIEDYFSVSYTSYYSGFTNILRVSIPNVTVLERFNYISGNTFKLESSTINYLYNYMSNSKSVTIGFVIETWNGNSKIGESVELNKTCYITNCEPQIGNSNYLDINADTVDVTGDNQKIVRHLSQLRINVENLKAFKGASLSSCTVTINNISKSFSNISGTEIANAYIDYGNLDISEDTNAIVTLIDSRGYSITKTIQLDIQNYILLSINANAKRTQPTTGEVEVEFSGNYYNGNIGSSSNTLSMRWFYREKNTVNWTLGGTINPTVSNNTYSNGNSPISLGNIFTYTKAYEIYLEVKDVFSTLEPIFTITQGIPIFNWEEDFFNINGDIKQKGELLSNYSKYSTNETIVGTWKNNKPIYRKIYETTSTSTGFDMTVLDIEQVTRISTINEYHDSVHYGVSVLGDNSECWIYGGVLNYRFTLSNVTFDKVTIILEYTKTTD